LKREKYHDTVIETHPKTVRNETLISDVIFGRAYDGYSLPAAGVRVVVHKQATTSSAIGNDDGHDHESPRPM